MIGVEGFGAQRSVERAALRGQPLSEQRQRPETAVLTAPDTTAALNRSPGLGSAQGGDGRGGQRAGPDAAGGRAGVAGERGRAGRGRDCAGPGGRGGGGGAEEAEVMAGKRRQQKMMRWREQEAGAAWRGEGRCGGGQEAGRHGEVGEDVAAGGTCL